MVTAKFKACFRLARPHQYIKNGFIWLPLFFGYKIHDLNAFKLTCYAFLIFCLASSSIYIINDLIDVSEDRRHPVKKNRPLASGALRRSEALIFFSVLLSLGLFFSFFFLPLLFLGVLGIYLLLNLAYSTVLKQIPIIDVICIATGFVIRVFAGGTAINIVISHWIVIMTFLIALFLALAKRRDDLVLIEEGYKEIRKTIDGYNLEFISLSMGIMGSVTIVSYILYTVSPEIIKKHGTNQLYLTAFWVIIGILRYLQITFVEQRSGSPTLVLIKDVFLQIVVALWIVTFYLLLYI